MYNINLTLNNTFLKSDIKMHINITMLTIYYNKTFCLCKKLSCFDRPRQQQENTML